MSHLYVCQFSNGFIKVGKTENVHKRVRQHAERVSCIGVSLARIESVQCAGSATMAEAALIARCAAKAESRHKREWFTGLEFHEVAAWMTLEGAAERHPAAQCTTPDVEPATVPQQDGRFVCLWEKGTHRWIDKEPNTVLWPTSTLMRWNLRQKDWGEIWPELLDHPCSIHFAPVHPWRDGPPQFANWVRSWPSAKAGAELVACMPAKGRRIVQSIWPELAEPERVANV